jgi:OmpA-OmpF porin, OOP family
MNKTPVRRFAGVCTGLRPSGISRAGRGAIALAALLVLIGPLRAMGQSDVADARDHEQIPRYEGSWMLGHETKRFDRFALPTGPAVRRDGQWQGETEQVLEGARTRLLYVAPQERSTLEVFRNYQAALAERGFETLYSCSGRECGNNNSIGRNILWARDRQLANAGDKTRYAFGGMHDDHYLAARNAEGTTWVGLYVARNDFKAFADTYLHPVILVEVVDVGAMEQRMIDAAAMAESISETGKVVLENIYFDFGKATLKPESDPALAEMAKLLVNNTSVSVYVVGHTDNVGGHDANMELSRARAAAVVDALVSRHGVERARIVPAGVGPLAPLASNDTEAGRGKNRRVELVQR